VQQLFQNPRLVNEALSFRVSVAMNIVVNHRRYSTNRQAPPLFRPKGSAKETETAHATRICGHPRCSSICLALTHVLP
jgi:hypothetical protein